jgi:hypothetical protein
MKIRSIIAVAMMFDSAAIAHTAAVRTVALSGQPAPGTTSGVIFSGFNPLQFALNEAGQTAFLGYLEGPDVIPVNNEGVWSEGSGSLALLAREGSHPPGMAGEVYGSFSEPVLNDTGHTAFGARRLDPHTYLGIGSGIWSDRSGSVEFIAGTGMQAPGTPGGTNFTDVDWGALNDADQVAFKGYYTENDSTSGEGIWSQAAGSLALVARQGNQAPGLPAGVSFEQPFLFGWVLNNSGRTAFTAYDTNGMGVWSDRSGSLSLVAHSGSQAPGLPSGVNYGGFLDPVLNGAGQTAFWAYLEGSGSGGAYDDGIWSEGSGNLALVVRRGSHAPGTAAGVIFSNEHVTTFYEPVLNDAGQTAFRAYLSGSGVDSTNNQGIWLGGADSLALVARSGEHAPGTPGGVEFGGFHSALQSNATGQVAFGAGVNDGKGGIWATDRNGHVQLVARVGDLLEVVPGDFRTISEVSFGHMGTGNGDGRPSGFNDLGQLAFWARFEGGAQGLFVSNRVAVPEPMNLVVLTICVPFLHCRRLQRPARTVATASFD